MTDNRRYLAPAMSAFAFPGLGQMINGQVAKGVTLLAVTVALVGLAFGFSVSCLRRWRNNGDFNLQLLLVAGVIFMAVFLAMWIYGIVDAYRVGKRLDRAATAKEG